MNNNQINVQVNDGRLTQTISLIGNVTSQEVVQHLLSLAQKNVSETEAVKNFLERTGTTISIETPDSTNIQRIQFNQVLGEIVFEFDNGSVATYTATFDGFLEALKAPSAGKLQWEYRRGLK